MASQEAEISDQYAEIKTFFANLHFVVKKKHTYSETMCRAVVVVQQEVVRK